MKIFLLLFCISISSVVHAGSLHGYVQDATSGEPLTGATIYIKDIASGTSAGLDGSYKIKDLPQGTHTVVVSMIGYTTIERQVIITDDKITTLNFSLVESTNQLTEVIVKGISEDKSEIDARVSEQRADNVINIISEKTIQLLPDVTVGNILQRVSGVSITRNSSGDGQYAIIRGMDKRYNYTLVNGFKIPSPDNKNRYVPMDIFPGDLLERLEVTKALTPNMEGDAIGGAMNMVMKSAPKKLSVSVTSAVGYSDIINSNRPFAGFNTKNIASQSPETLHGPLYKSKPEDFGVSQLQYKDRNAPLNSLLSFSIGNRLFNDKLGIIVAGSYQNIFRGTNSIFYVPSQPLSLPYNNTYAYQEVQIRKNSNRQNRLGLMAKLDYVLNDKNKFSFFNFFSQLDEAQHRNYYNPIAIGPGLATNDVHDRSKFTSQSIYNSSLHGDHIISDRIKADWSLVYSNASGNSPAWSDMNVRSRYEDGTLVRRELLPVTQRWTNNKDQDKTGYLNFNYTPAKAISIGAGGMMRFKTRSNVYAEYELNTTLNDGSQNFQSYTSIDKAVFSFVPESNAYANLHDPNNYTAKENISAFYVQARVNITEKFQVLGGVRNENTYQEYHSQLDVTVAGKDGKIQYADLLPSVHFKYAINGNQNLRLSYYKAVARPGYFDFVPVEISGDLFTEVGNPFIKHTTANNFDFRYEYFVRGLDQILAGVFYKDINNPIEYGFIPATVSTSYVQPQNQHSAANYGFEVVVAKYVRNWGVTANYTYTSSSITQSKGVVGRFKDSNGVGYDSTYHQNQTRPLQGQSKHIANVSLIYKNSVLGFDAQLAWVYTGRRINVVSPYKDLDYWQRGFSQVDFSAEKKIFRRFQFFIKITNLLDTPMVTEVLRPLNAADRDSPGQDNNKSTVVQKDVFRQTFLAGLRFKL
jgi:outer membrane receptor protein involved in Fe transport